MDKQGLIAMQMNNVDVIFMTVSNRYIHSVGLDFIIEEIKSKFSRKHYDNYGFNVNPNDLDSHVYRADKKTKEESIHLYEWLLYTNNTKIVITKKGETPYKLIV